LEANGTRLIPLGGLGEFGLNALVLEHAGRLLLVDAGVLFAGADMPGVDTIVPDFRYLADRKDALEAIVLTHAHEDHIGALPFALQAAAAPVYGTRLTLGLVRRRLQERGMGGADLRVIAPGEAVEAGPFRIHPIRVAHSVCDSVALAVEAGPTTVLLSGDFKIDAQAAPTERTDLEALASWGRRGADVLLSDSTNVEARGAAGGEDAVLPAFEEVFARTRGKVLVSCFATSFPRIDRVAALARRFGRQVGFLGRRMEDNAELALELGLLSLAPGEVVPPPALSRQAPGALAVFVSGSQGEPLSALSLIGVDEHPDLGVGPGDTLVLSARPIPGNERAVSRLIGNVFRRGADVVHSGTARVHVSGHGHRDELAELLRLVRPRHFVPVHGEFRMLAQHARLAVEAGVPEAGVHLLEDGDTLELDADGARRGERAPAGRTLLDRAGADEVEDLVVRDRRQLSAQGIVVPVVVLDRQTGRVESAPEIVTRGFVDPADRGAGLLEDAGRLVVEAVEARPPEERHDPALTRERVRLALRRFFRRRTQRRPMVIPVVMEV
jgi:ribonuclease J